MLLPPVSRSHPELWFAMNNGWVFSLNLILSRDTSKMDNFLNPFWFSVPFLYPLEMSENLWLSGVSSRYRNGTLGWKGLIKIFSVLRNRIIILHGKITFPSTINWNDFYRKIRDFNESHCHRFLVMAFFLVFKILLLIQDSANNTVLPTFVNVVRNYKKLIGVRSNHWNLRL